MIYYNYGLQYNKTSHRGEIMSIENTIDIYSKGEYPSNVLSNFYPNEFTFDGVKCGSMEGFLQSLKYRSIKQQQKICLLSGKEAKKKGKYKFLWKLTGNIHWQGRKIKRTSQEYKTLIKSAYKALSENQEFSDAIKATENKTLVHSIGSHDERKTILTEKEFINMLYYIRETTQG
jgi:predicted NAD-dependent protein-ADP-ribosyltransferase YbiA (DUF1768 family)